MLILHLTTVAKSTSVVVVLGLCAAGLFGQTTQGIISGRLVNSITGRPVGDAVVAYSGSTGTLAGQIPSDAAGYYYLPLLSPGMYRVRVLAAGFQSQEVQELELPVAARIELDFRLRPLSDVWEAGQYNSVFLPGSQTIVTFYGPDVDTSRSGSFEAQKGHLGSLEAAVSYVIDSEEINALPLAGRDVYTLLVTEPAVSSDLATSRGLGLSVNGQRPSASNFMLDGLENNNYLITGPLVTVAPEAVQEYRISTNNYSAEYGRTSGFIANAITRSGSNDFHGVGYFYLMNDALNANAFQTNLGGFPRTPDKQIQPGFVVGGPVLKNRLFFSSSHEYFRSRSQNDPQVFTFPSATVLGFSAANSEARELLQSYAPPVSSGTGLTTKATFAQPVDVDRTLAIQRFDYIAGKDRVMGRAMGSIVLQPDFVWSPYAAFDSALHENTWSAAVTDTHTFRPTLTNEARAGFSDDDLFWNRAHSEIPTLVSLDGTTLPGSPAFYAYKNLNKSTEFLDNVIWMRGRHQVTAGAGILVRGSSGFETAGRDGEYLFSNVLEFALDHPGFFSAAVDRTALPTVQVPDSNRSWDYRQYFAFLQDTFKISSRFTLNYGLRYELYGAPNNTSSTKDVLVQLGAGSNLASQLTSATLNPNGTQIFGTDKNDWAGRAGASYDLFGNSRTILRGGFGIFYDRPFDNLWENVRNNNFILPIFTLTAVTTNYVNSVSKELQTFSGSSSLSPANSTFPDLTLIDPNLQNGRVYSYFAGVEQRFTDHLVLDVNGQGSYGRNLITTDIVNRDFSTPAGRYNPNLPDIAYRSGQGFSDYNALATVLRYRAGRGMLQASYTWSHAIDNQSEPLAGDFFNLNFTAIQSASPSAERATFTEQFDPNADRGNSDFDQRQNLVLLGYWNLPFGFMASGLAAFRSGEPYTLLGPTAAVPGGGEILSNRPNILNPSEAFPSTPVAGGVQLLNPAAFGPAAPSTLGNLGRNAFTGPGFYSLDVSLARAFAVGEGRRITIRASAFNLLNHANLNNPDSNLNSPTFGIALYGRLGVQSGFPAVAPLNETPRQIQLSLKFEF
jgi:hypothetical protein